MVTLSCAFATSMDTPEHVRIAESLGYERAWLYDSPALYPDVWVALALAAEQTSTIGLGPGVLVPSLRHPMTNAAAIATLAALAPGRVAVAVGAGFTGRHVLGQRAMRWTDVAEYVRVVKALLRGEAVMWDGALIQMIHPPASSPTARSRCRSSSPPTAPKVSRSRRSWATACSARRCRRAMVRSGAP